jgi:hypothetical protein
LLSWLLETITMSIQPLSALRDFRDESLYL